MHSVKNIDDQKKQKRSFIEEARRVQIINAAIDVIAELGASQASLAKIADKASISTSLILYHFKDKEELMAAVLASIIADWEEPAAKAMALHTSPSAKLRSYIEARLVYIGTRPKQSIAMINLLFAVRPSDNTQAYRTEEQGFELDDIAVLLKEGQEKGEFKSFNIDHMAMMIRSTIDQFLGYSQVPGIDLEQYVKDLLGWYGVLISKKESL
jgi:TetR/AcrR family transcriptional regulator, transcriptional repressor of bet genes